MEPRSIVATMLAVALAGASVSVGAEEGGADDTEARAAFAEEGRSALGVAMAEVDAILADETASPEDKRARIAFMLGRWLDLAFITRAALGSNADGFSQDQYADFSQEFGRYVVAIYVRRIARARVSKLELQGARWDEKTRTVIVETRGGKPLALGPPELNQGGPSSGRVDYRLRKRRGGWRILSISIDGADSVRLFRGQFEAVLGEQGPDEVIAKLREHNARLEDTSPFE
jgi:ABC-type transporter MlaC component